MYIVHILEGAIEQVRVFWNNFDLWHTVAAHLILIGTRGDTFISFSFLDQILSIKFLKTVSE